MVAGGSNWAAYIENAITTYHQNIQNVYNKNRPGISTPCSTYEASLPKQESFVGTIWFCASTGGAPHKAEIYTCFKTPCSDVSNHMRITVDRGH